MRKTYTTLIFLIIMVVAAFGAAADPVDTTDDCTCAGLVDLDLDVINESPADSGSANLGVSVNYAIEILGLNRTSAATTAATTARAERATMAMPERFTGDGDHGRSPLKDRPTRNDDTSSRGQAANVASRSSPLRC